MSMGTENQEVDLDNTDEIEVEIQDDTPEEDRGRPRKAESESESDTPAVEEDDDDADLGKHSESVQKRIKKLKFEYHEERRRKETADREREAAVQYAQQVKGENDRLRKNLNEGESVLITQAKARIASELANVKARIQIAYEAGDPDAVLECTRKVEQTLERTISCRKLDAAETTGASGSSTTSYTCTRT
jgi:hypothetical protein